MKFFRMLFMRFQNYCETTENHFDGELKTRYFKATFNQIFDTMEKILLNNRKYKILTNSKEHGEFAVEIVGNEKLFLIVSIVSIRPLETAVDIKVSTDKFNILGSYPKLKQEILSLYRALNEKHTYIGNGLNEAK